MSRNRASSPIKINKTVPSQFLVDDYANDFQHFSDRPRTGGAIPVSRNR